MKIRSCLAATGFAIAVSTLPLPALCQEIADRKVLIGKLIPITGDFQRSVDLTVPFQVNSTKLTQAAQAQLDELGAALGSVELRGLNFGVFGHTDASGSATYNLKLSKERALAVVAYLVDRFKIPHARLKSAGYGESRLLEGLKPTAARHRRVEIVAYAPKGTTEPNKSNPPEKKKDGGFRAIN